MPAALVLSDESIDDLDAFAAALEAVGLRRGIPRCARLAPSEAASKVRAAGSG